MTATPAATGLPLAHTPATPPASTPPGCRPP